MATKHSKAPWSLKRANVVAADGTHVARVIGRGAAGGPQSITEADANAQLMCLSPQLLKAVKIAVRQLKAKRHPDMVLKALEAVLESAKA